MSTPSPSPASGAPRQLTVPLPLEPNPESYRDIEVASSSTHLALGKGNSVLIYSLPAFDLVDTINPGRIAEYIADPLKIYGRLLGILCVPDSEDFEKRCFLYIWDLSARKHVGTVICNCESNEFLYTSVSLPSAKISEDSKLEETTPEWPRDPVLIVASPADDGNNDNLAIYELHCPDAGSIEGAIKNPQGPLPVTPATEIHSVPQVLCLASMGRTVVIGGSECTVSTWDIIVGKCQMLFIGHTDPVTLVDLDEERIYSSSYDNTIRVWNRYTGDCLHVHVLEVVKFSTNIFLTSSYIVALTNGSELSIWDIVSGKLEHRINNQRLWDLDPVRGWERTLATIERDENQSIFWFRILDLRSGQAIRTSLFKPIDRLLGARWFIQGRFYIDIAREDKEYVLKIRDFGANDAEYGEVRNDDYGSSRDNAFDKTEDARKDDCGMSVSPSPSSSAIQRVLPRNPKTTEKQKKRSVQHGQNSPGFNWRGKYTKQGAGVELSAITALATFSVNPSRS